jgi:predicted O-methyltransferase YrrM
VDQISGERSNEVPRLKDRLAHVQDVISRLFESGTVLARRDGKLHSLFPIGVPSREGEALRAWVKREDAVTTIEVGLGYGISALFICHGLLANGHPNARHVALDPKQLEGFSGVGLQVIDEADAAGMLEFYAERSEIALPRFLSSGRLFDLAFIDGNHRFDGVFLDLIYLGRLVRGSGVIVLDDYQLPSAKKAVRFCVTNLGWALQEEGIADARHHWAVLRTPAVPLERNFDQFVDF